MDDLGEAGILLDVGLLAGELERLVQGEDLLLELLLSQACGRTLSRSQAVLGAASGTCSLLWSKSILA